MHWGKSKMKIGQILDKYCTQVFGYSKRLVLFFTAMFCVLTVGLILIQYQVSDIGGAKRDARVGHLPLIQYIAKYSELPNPAEYAVAHIPLWHFSAAGLINISGGIFLIHIFQVFLALLSLYLLFTILCKITAYKIAILGTMVLAFNGYFIAFSYFPTTDGLAVTLFMSFVWVLVRIQDHPGGIFNTVLLNLIISCSVLNRQMFLFLFLIYGLSLIGKRRILLIFTDVLPSIIVIGTGFFYFYVKYCDLLNSDECWPVRQTRDLYFPVLVNLPVVCFLVALFFFPVLYLNRDFSIISKTRVLSIFIGVFIFFGLVGNGLIEKGSFVVGGGLYKFRQGIGSISLVFDVVSVSLFIVILYLSYMKLSSNKWILHSVLVLSISSLFGPFAFQRYYEPYLLILAIVFIFSNSLDIFMGKSRYFLTWIFAMCMFQVFEFVASCFINI